MVVKIVLAALLRLLYRVKVRGLENSAAAGDRVVIVANHVSFLDGLLLAVFLPGRPTFAIDTQIARRWWVRPALRLFDAVTIDPTSPLATKVLIRAVQSGRQCVIFPEGRITVTGALMKIYEGPGMIADKAEAPILPVRIDGAQYTAFSRLRGKVRLRWFPPITITVLPPRRITARPALKGRQRRQDIGLKLHDLMTELVFQTCDWNVTLFSALLDARNVHGGRSVIVEDVGYRPLTYHRLVAGSLVLGRRLARLTGHGEYVGVLLPNSAAAAVTFFALQAFGRVPALLNFSTGSAGMLAACQAARLKVVLTSRRFITAARLDAVLADLERQAKIIRLEDIHSAIGVGDKLIGVLRSRLPALAGRSSAAKPGDPAVVLFTSGSEGTPKGVVLSHANIMANRYQLGAVVDFNSTDRVFNALPIFHSFGLTGGLLLPLLTGVRTFLYPSPLHYRIVPLLAYGTDATILFGTDTFLSGYARAAHPYDFYSVRYVFAGAERVREETREAWFRKFGLRILEGYGATETSPVIAVNTAMHFKAGSVGRFVPGIDHKLEPVPGVAEGGRLLLSGPNVMMGYLRVERPGQIEPPQDGVYDTGDIVSIDEMGFITILGRVKRFAKIAGEMVSLTAIERLAGELWPNDHHAVIAIPDEKKGEQLVLVTDRRDAARGLLLDHAHRAGAPELFVPRRILSVAEVPVLGTGKIDYGRVAQLARERLSAPYGEAAPLLGADVGV
jgi:acyl-[acyl-carrier-protein]-phospholipid O-acyltransferase/long-chain-fatty-acid--[acyl-carrier-protein] ligase